ncbi:XrtA/PEP-CTERM system histidine kinase PrsK [Erythrobacter sp. HKB08]|uniref:XrtA/PEP-CTERM system histidine kinase PrsK n=1 Tax=Erythrobacter sp. HKB08 TaxID=2502843 RepID=UPI001008B02B|nr:XrtA/PEP-CTERM system histidine kinase PrsK [Erythrobacter sp. HKB08]
MSGGVDNIWILLAFAFHIAGAAACCVAIAWIMRRGDAKRTDRIPLVAALTITAGWSVSHAALGPLNGLTAWLEIVRNLSWIYVIFKLYANDGRDQSMRPIRPVAFALGFVECLQAVLIVIATSYATTPEPALLVLQIMAMLRILVAIGALVLLHNLYVGAAQPVRQTLRWTTAAFAALWAFDLNVYTIAYLGSTLPVEMMAVRGLVVATAAIPLAIGSSGSSAAMRLKPSRAVTFQTLSLLVIGAYLLVMVGIAQSLSMLGGDIARLTQVGFTFAATVVALLWLPSKRLRGWVKVTAVKHLFQHRYDYRAEWLRFTRTIAEDREDGHSLHERAVKAMADITDSPAGLLLVRDDNGGFELASRWKWGALEVPASPISNDFSQLLERDLFIVDVDDARGGSDRKGELSLIPQWLVDEPKAWAMVPLVHFDRLTGIIVLARPSDPRRLDWEDFDLLRIVGQQLASYLAEQSVQQALMEAARFDEFNRRIAFVMHDVKNLASQLSLLARNAELHAEKPEFRADMLVTLRKSSEKLNNLIARLNRYGTSASDHRETISLSDLARQVCERMGKLHPVQVIAEDEVEVVADRENLEQALIHLVQNAIDASEAEQTVFIEVSTDKLKGRIQVVDSGAGMTPEFVRSGLFKPFVSSKSSGFGIGAYEARELVRAMGGRLDVESREGLGTRFSITFPLNEVSDLFKGPDDAITSEVA